MNFANMMQQAQKMQIPLKQIKPIVPSINFDMEVVLVQDYSLNI